MAREPTPADLHRGRALLKKMWEVHGDPSTGGVQVVESVATHDIALAPYRWLFGAWSHNPQPLRGLVVFGTDDCFGHPHGPAERPMEFSHDRFAEDQPVLRHDSMERVEAKTASGKRADQDGPVEEDPHERSRKRSSSVRQPRASARGIMRRRKSSS